MLSPEIVDEVRRLLAEGVHSQRKIARLTGVSRGSVCAIANGRRTERRRCSDEDQERPSGPPRRCPGCGGMVYMPCLLCRAREKSNVARRAFFLRRVSAPAGLELRPEHHARYLQVRDWRRRNHGRPFKGEIE
ncbi:MAG: helix-turn-helix domain-containing protein [Pirellulales bacterium]|nr:helix-turn-helix domain-containing protein [Pirellulales bacterium]